MSQRDKIPPALKNYVIQAVASLRERRGSTSREILDQIKTIIRKSPRYKERSRNLMLQIQRALHYCVENDLLKHQAGRYKLCKEYGKVMQTSQEQDDRKSGGKKKEEPKGNKKKRRRHSSSISTSSLLSGSSNVSSIGDSKTSGSSEGVRKKSSRGTIDKGRRRRKGKPSKGKKKGRKGKKRRRRSVSHSEGAKRSQDPPNPPDKPVTEKQTDLDSPSTSFSRHRKRFKSSRSNAVMDRDSNSYPDCGSPDCLCNTRQEQNDSTQRPEDDDYIN